MVGLRLQGLVFTHGLNLNYHHRLRQCDYVYPCKLCYIQYNIFLHLDVEGLLISTLLHIQTIFLKRKALQGKSIVREMNLWVPMLNPQKKPSIWENQLMCKQAHSSGYLLLCRFNPSPTLKRIAAGWTLRGLNPGGKEVLRNRRDRL